ncbi:MAG: Ger(x)C family spore germination protein [Gracilibacteraceae bacterium]|jgi:spore germination protein KC|nr:Ger(x)C family spore germination protein [Gracilibacteraceae bacterium]
MKAIKRLGAAAVMSCLLLLAGCWDKVEIEDRLFVLAIGVDSATEAEQKISEDRYTLSFVAPVVDQIIEGEGPTFHTYKTVENNLITSLTQLLERFSKKQFFGHTRAIFFGEDIMKSDKLLKEVLDGVSRYHELHNSMYAYIVPGRAEEVFEVKPMYDKLLAPYIAGITENSNYTSKAMRLSLLDMTIMLENQQGGLVIPKLVPGEKEVRLNGAGVLKGYKLIGYLGDKETSVYNWLMNKAKGGAISIEYNNTPTVFRHFTFNRKIRLAKVEEGKIYLNYEMETEGSIEEYKMGWKILDNVLLEEISREVEKRIEGESEKLIEKFQKQFKADLIGVKDYLSKYQPKLYKTIEKDYEKFFTDSIVVEVTANVKIRRVGLIK